METQRPHIKWWDINVDFAPGSGLGVWDFLPEDDIVELGLNGTDQYIVTAMLTSH